MIVEATIKAAEIQRDGAVYSALIGGLALGVGVFASWRTALHLQRVARLMETRKDVYLSLAASYSEMVTEIYLVMHDIKNNVPKVTQAIINFSKNVDKAIFICETDTKVEIVNFLKVFEVFCEALRADLNELSRLANELDDLSNQSDMLIKKFNDAMRVYDEVWMENPKSERVPNILNYTDAQLKRNNENIELIVKKEDELNHCKKTTEPHIDELVKELNSKVVIVTYKLRRELGAETDINLDTEINSRFNSD